jgi:hypothetical protein
VARDERGKGGFVTRAGKAGQQLVVGQFSHLPNNVRRTGKRTGYLRKSLDVAEADKANEAVSNSPRVHNLVPLAENDDAGF